MPHLWRGEGRSPRCMGKYEALREHERALYREAGAEGSYEGA